MIYEAMKHNKNNFYIKRDCVLFTLIAVKLE